jgi:hypothetical protein
MSQVGTAIIEFEALMAAGANKESLTACIVDARLNPVLG